jgi:hypothetical protein
MDSGKDYASALRKSLQEENFFDILTRFHSFCEDVLGYKEARLHQELKATAKIELVHASRDAPKITKKMNLEHGEFCSYYVKKGDAAYGDSGVVLRATYTGQSVSLAQILLLRKPRMHADQTICFAYGEEWRGKEIPTPECFAREFRIRAPKMKVMTVEELIRTYEMSGGN